MDQRTCGNRRERNGGQTGKGSCPERWPDCIQKNTAGGDHNARERKGTEHVAKAVETTGKGAVTKAFSPSVMSRLKMEIPVFPEFTSMVTGHRKTRSYLHRFGFTTNAKCPCDDGADQTVRHLMVRCTKLTAHRNKMIKEIKRTGGTWPVESAELITECLPIFVNFIRSIDYTDM
jgi:hypothetical protein